MSLGAVAAPSAGATVSVPITVTNLSSVGSITLKIAYNPSVVTFTGIANPPSGVNFTSNAAGGVITLIWYDATGTTPLTIASGKLIDLNFTYVAGSGTFTFNSSQCEVTTGTGTIITGVTYQNGSIGSGGSGTPTLTLGSVTTPSAGASVSVPITVTNFTSVGSITLKIAYDPAVVTFTGVANAPSGVNFTSNAVSGVITLIWYDASGSTPLTLASGKLVDLNFTYVAGSGTLSFNTSLCEITTGTGTIISGVTYQNGSIGTSGTSATITGFNPASGSVGTAVTITGTNFGSTQGTSTVKFGTTAATVTSWSSTSITATVPTLSAGGYTISVTTTSGTVNSATQFTVSAPATTTFTISNITAPAAGASMSVPITVTNLTSVGSITLKIAYDPAVVTFTGVANAPSGVNFTSNAVSGVITLIWYDATGSTPLTIASGKLVDLNFTYATGSSAFTFNSAQCEVTTGTGTIITGITYQNGTIASSTSTTFTLGAVTAPVAGGTATVPITVANLTSVGSVTLKIAYNSAVVTFTGVANAPTGVNFTSNAAGGVITLIWYDATGSTPLTIANNKLVDLKFTYISGTSIISFNSSQCEVTNGVGTIISGILYFNGSIGIVQNQKPTLNTISPITKAERDTVTFVVSATDPNLGDVLTYSAANLPTGASFTVATRTFLWVPTLGQNGTYTVKFKVSDGLLVDSTNAVITITKTNVKPTFNVIPAITKKEMDTVTFVVSATDPNPGDVLTYTATNLPTGASFTAASRTFLWVPTLGKNGTYTVKFKVSDGLLADSTNAVITITKVNLIVKNPIADMTLDDNPIAHRTVKIKLTSPPVFANNIDVLTYTTTSANTNVVTATIISPDTLQIKGLKAGGPVLVTVTAKDVDNSQITDSMNVTVTGTTGVHNDFSIPTDFTLSQNYPNPFNPSTIIQFGLPVSSPVTMEIYTMLGVKVRTLLHQEMKSAGIHEMEWDGKDDAGVSVTSGVYLYRMNAGTFQVSKKMMMLK
jgi:hypothetical protein